MEPKLEIHELPTDALVPYEHNAKLHPKKQIDEIAKSIEEFGDCDPIAVWHNEQGKPEIVEGHGRLLALKRLGIKTAPVIYLDHLTDEQRRVYTHVHNQTTLSSGFDYDTLTEDMDSLDADWEALGFSDYLPSFEHDEVSEEEMPTDIACRCKPGDVWGCGGHRLMCGSSTDGEDMRKLAGGGSPT